MEPSLKPGFTIEEPQAFAKRLGLPIRDMLLLRRALTHSSYLNEHPEALEDNERLEFLGDAVLDFLVGAWLYSQYPEMREGQLTRMRSALVRTEQLADFAHQAGLEDAMRLGRGEFEGGGRARPALLCGTFEAVVGALYLDQGMQAVQAFILPYLEAAASQIIANHTQEDPKSLLQEWAQGQGLGAPQYQTVATSGPEHLKEFAVQVVINGAVFGEGAGQSKQSAAKAAAQDALARLDREDLPYAAAP